MFYYPTQLSIIVEFSQISIDLHPKLAFYPYSLTRPFYNRSLQRPFFSHSFYDPRSLLKVVDMSMLCTYHNNIIHFARPLTNKRSPRQRSKVVPLSSEQSDIQWRTASIVESRRVQRVRCWWDYWITNRQQSTCPSHKLSHIIG